ncbi:hypothetical protein MMC13_004360 [Lambiella insularis]|nr:hypothetical protein [Lambiella insularis]
MPTGRVSETPEPASPSTAAQPLPLYLQTTAFSSHPHPLLHLPSPPSTFSSIPAPQSHPHSPPSALLQIPHRPPSILIPQQRARLRLLDLLRLRPVLLRVRVKQLVHRPPKRDAARIGDAEMHPDKREEAGGGEEEASGVLVGEDGGRRGSTRQNIRPLAAMNEKMLE